MHPREHADLLGTANLDNVALVQRHAISPIGREGGRVSAAQHQANHRILVQHQRGNVGQVRGDRHQRQRFGSRVDVYLPDGVQPLVAAGQTATAGETVIADLRGSIGEFTFRIG